MSPSSFIPFCEFGGNLNITGVEINQFQIPVCNHFKPTILAEKLCYTFDVDTLNDDRNGYSRKLALNKGLVFLMDYNLERNVVKLNQSKTNTAKNMLNAFDETNLNKIAAKIYINTRSNPFILILQLF